MTDTTTTAPLTAFCQNCGISLTPASMRTVGPAIYCEPCLDARLHGAQPPSAAAFTAGPSIPNPGLAALLGLIPGVGAMYNEQYAKGIVHLIVFAVLVALSDTIGILGIFIAGWVFYMVIEAHHTARARRDHTPLPNPFGLNDIGERLGFGKAWPAGAPNVASVFHDAATVAAQSAQHFQQQHQSHVNNPWPYSQPSKPQVDPMPTQAPFNPPSPSSFGDWQHTTHQYAQNSAAGTQEPWRDTFNSAPPLTPQAPYAPPAITGHQRFPAGAIWLIGAGVFFLLATTGIFRVFHKEVVVGFGLIGLAVWLFFRRLLAPCNPLYADANYPFRAIRAFRSAAWVGLTGFLFLLNTFGILHWNHSWPLYIILAGVMGFLQRAAPHHNTLGHEAPGSLL